MNEQWKDIKGYEGLYQISDKGNIKSLERIVKDSSGRIYKRKEKLLSTKPWMKNGRPYYVKVSLIKEDGKKENKAVHRLVAESFIPNPESKPEVNHIDQHRDNNLVENLEWVSKEENMKHAVVPGGKGINNNNSILTEKDVKNICILLQSGYSNLDITEELEVSSAVVSNIKYKRQWTHLDCVKNLPDYEPISQVKITEKDVENICKLLKETSLTREGIIEELKLDIQPNLISKIKNKKRWKHLKCVQEL
jgi:hypothetical protein